MDIKSVLKAHGETTYTLAEKMGISQPSLHASVTGNPTVKRLEEIARALGCSPAEFFNDWPSPTSPQQPAEGGQQEADNLPFKPDGPADTEQPQQAEQVRAVRFTYECPKCGERISVTIE